VNAAEATDGPTAENDRKLQPKLKFNNPLVVFVAGVVVTHTQWDGMQSTQSEKWK
jgi:hypothetical protein